MNEVQVADLIPGVIYRIHWNGHNNDMLGTFLFHHHNRPCFTNVNYQNILFGDPGERPRKIDKHQIAFDPAHHTFYKSGKTINEENKRNSLGLVLDGIVPGLGKDGKKFAGTRRRKRSRYNKRV
jgi:hypothetical protein